MENLENIPAKTERMRLQALFDSAERHSMLVNQRGVEGSLEIYKEKTHYFEKIALGCGGAITLIVSFIGSHTGMLQPTWLIRAALVTLLLAMITAMFRNWKFPFYKHYSYLLEQSMADLKKEGRRAEILNVPGSSPINFYDGNPVDLPKELDKIKKNEEVLKANIVTLEKKQASALRWVNNAEFATTILSVGAMALLLAIAWINF